MGLPSFLGLSLFMFVSALSISVGQGNTDRSAISFTLCDGFTGEVNFRINIKDKQGNKVSTRFRGATRQKYIDEKIDQKNVKHVRVISDHEICFQALVIDTTIIIDQPTNFKDSCETKEIALPCKKLSSKVKPVLICPQALTKLLKEKGVIENEPKLQDHAILSLRHMTSPTTCYKRLRPSPMV